MNHRRDFNGRLGVSIIELMVLAAILAILLSVLIPMIRSVRIRQHDLVDVMNAGMTLKDFRVWSQDRDGVMPNAGHYDDPIVPEYYEQGSNPVGHYIIQVQDWVDLLCFSGFEPSKHWHTTRGPDDAGGQIDLAASDDPQWLYSNPSRFLLSSTLRFAPDIWTPGRTTRISWEELQSYFRNVRWESVRFPSSKGMLVNRSRKYGSDRWHVGFVDGSARMIRSAEAMPGVPYPWGGGGDPGPAILATEYGYLGRDL
ncbi:MAG: type II secretion system protein [Phycisphaerales bacterium]